MTAKAVNFPRMLLLSKALEDKKFDLRIIEKNLARGILQAQEQAKSVQQLPDDSASAEWVSLDDIQNSDG